MSWQRFLCLPLCFCVSCVELCWVLLSCVERGKNFVISRDRVKAAQSCCQSSNHRCVCETSPFVRNNDRGFDLSGIIVVLPTIMICFQFASGSKSLTMVGSPPCHRPVIEESNLLCNQSTHYAKNWLWLTHQTVTALSSRNPSEMRALPGKCCLGRETIQPII